VGTSTCVRSTTSTTLIVMEFAMLLTRVNLIRKMTVMEIVCARTMTLVHLMPATTQTVMLFAPPKIHVLTMRKMMSTVTIYATVSSVWTLVKTVRITSCVLLSIIVKMHVTAVAACAGIHVRIFAHLILSMTVIQILFVPTWIRAHRMSTMMQIVTACARRWIRVHLMQRMTWIAIFCARMTTSASWTLPMIRMVMVFAAMLTLAQMTIPTTLTMTAYVA